jgi:hypothetical protein
VPIFHRHLPDGFVDGDARVVDQDVQAAVLVDHIVNDALAVLPVAHVALMQRQRASVGLDRLAQLVSPPAVGGEARRDHRAVRGEAVADRRANPPGPSRDQRHPSGQTLLPLGFAGDV